MRNAIVIIGLAGVVGLGLWAISAQAKAQKPPMNETAIRNERLGMTNRISGTVTTPSGAPIGGIVVRARFQMHMTGAQGEGTTTTSADGTFELRGLGNNQFVVLTDGEAAAYIPSNQVLVNLTAKTSVMGVKLVTELGPEITVRAIDAETKKPVSGVGVKIQGHPGMYPLVTGQTNDKGEFVARVGTLTPVIALDDHIQNDKWAPAPGETLYREYKLAKPVATTVVYKLYQDPYTNRPATFTGRVLDAAGKPMSGVEVSRYQEDARAVTDDQGKFSLKTSRIRIHDSIVTIFLKSGLKVNSYRLAPSDTWSEMSLTFENKSASFTATVVDEKGNPAPGCPVIYWALYPGTSQSVNGAEAGLTDENGKFTLQGLAPGGSIRFRFGNADNSEYGETMLPGYDVAGFEIAAGSSEYLGQVTVMHAVGTLSGTLTDLAGKPLTKTWMILVRGKHTNRYAYPAADGSFSMKGLVDEALTLLVVVGSETGYRTGRDSPDIVQQRAVKAGEKVVLRVKPRLAKP